MQTKPLVVLIGDSIRMGYQDVVRANLQDVARVWAPEENGGDSDKVLAHLDEWVLSRRPAVLHLNCGLHDLKRAFGQEPAVSLERYEENLRRLFGRLRDELDGTVVWATTTPVNEAWHHERKGFDRFAADVDAYNQVARGVAGECGVPIDDLFTRVMEAGRDRLLVADGVHYGEAGNSLLGENVAGCVRGYL